MSCMIILQRLSPFTNTVAPNPLHLERHLIKLAQQVLGATLARHKYERRIYRRTTGADKVAVRVLDVVGEVLRALHPARHNRLADLALLVRKGVEVVNAEAHGSGYKWYCDVLVWVALGEGC